MREKFTSQKIRYAQHGGMYDRAAIAAQVAKIRLEVDEKGGSTVGCEELRYLCPEEFTAREQFMHVATIAQRNGWSFTFRADGTVHFAACVKAAK